MNGKDLARFRSQADWSIVAPQLVGTTTQIIDHLKDRLLPQGKGWSMRSATLVSKLYRLGKTQGQLDFIDVPVNTDIRLYVDPFAISQRVDRWSHDAHASIIGYFQRVVDAIRPAIEITRSHCCATCASRTKPDWEILAGDLKVPVSEIGRHSIFLAALEQSSAVKTGLLQLTGGVRAHDRWEFGPTRFRTSQPT